MIVLRDHDHDHDEGQWRWWWWWCAITKMIIVVNFMKLMLWIIIIMMMMMMISYRSIYTRSWSNWSSIYLCLGILLSSSTTIVSSISQRRGCTLSWSTAPKVGVLMQLTSYRRWQLKWYDAASFFNLHYDNKLSTVSICMIVIVELLIWNISIDLIMMYIHIWWLQ